MTIHETDLLMGNKNIARFLGLTPRQVSWHDEQGNLPTFRMGRTVCARKSTLMRWIEDQEKARRDVKKPH
ncbi:DNA-binding protein [Phyllobacterium brassicacearum]|uniref:DNA-binding protein n=1 Tax=Phyllobacterium brassicacearum TaxID=314235 RepID=A0A2P7BQ24_9HYPH|nr:DNA-binding protein [Phyllobacterium brassicacearum]PSH68546.1 DNA-binding protein [Phyllobacterium brassicacearum]TDQ19894.1 hypothetical protein DEV91_12489 [Phyllobacterium brassicacearum]